MKICIMSDTHLSAVKYLKVDKELGLNRFLVRQFQSMEWVMNYLRDNNISTIVHAGDFFDTPNVGVYPLKRASELFRGTYTYAIKGNHDDTSFLHDNNMSSLDLIGINAINKPTKLSLGSTNFVMIPWGFEVDTSLLDNNKKNVLVTHAFPRDYLGDGKVSKQDTNVAGLLSNKALLFDLVITGHYHKVDEFQEGKTRFLNPGSLSAFANDDTDPSIWILDTETLSYERVKIPCAIKLYKIRPRDVNTYLQNINEENIYRFYLRQDARVDSKLLLQAKRVALDIQFRYNDSQVKKEKVEAVNDFWSYVKDIKTAYLKDFQDTLQTLEQQQD